jgi:hypothetical protein
MRALISTLLVCTMAASTYAQAPAPQPQPYPAPQPYPPPQPQPYPPPQPYGQPIGPTYGYGQQPVMQYQLTLDDQELLSRGYISDGQWIAGGLANLAFGFGIGQAIQGRWSDGGYIFTLGEGVSFGVMIWGMVELFESCSVYEECNDGGEDRGFGLMMLGLTGYAVFHVWSIIDAFAGPPAHNRKLRNLHMRMGYPVPMYSKVTPYLGRPRDGGTVAGFTVRF